jgi:hypothetical protein
MRKRLPLYYKKLRDSLKKCIGNYWRLSRWNRFTVVFFAILFLAMGGMYGVARWYIAQNSGKPLVLGVSFIPAYAESLGLDAQQTLDALIQDAGVRQFRLVSYWNQLEPQQGKYDFSLLDWQMHKIEVAGGKVSLSLGLRQPRWPECHMPAWASGRPVSEWQPRLEAYMTAVVNRYKNSPALDSYQVENEFFLKGFGNCETVPNSMDRERLVSEYNLVKTLDPEHKAIVNRSNNALGWPVGQPQPDEFGISIYKRTWDANATKRYLEYPFPGWFYGFVAGWQKLMTGRDMVIHELQAESWAPNNKSVAEISVAEANKSFDAKRFEDRIEFGRATGMREIYLWGSEYWYFRMVKQNDPSLWNVARMNFQHED